MLTSQDEKNEGEKQVLCKRNYTFALFLLTQVNDTRQTLHNHHVKK